jgi:hypothetical protein
MAEANDSINVTPGAGASVATQLVNGKEYQVVVTANPNGQLIGDIPTYSIWSGNITAAANKVYMHIFNASGSGKIIKIRKVFIQPSQSAVVGVSQQWRFSRTSSVGTTGTRLNKPCGTGSDYSSQLAHSGRYGHVRLLGNGS